MTKKSEELDKLWQLHHAAYLQGNGDSYKNQLIECSLPYIKIIANEIHLRSSPNIELDDLKSEGVFGAIEAIKTFDPNKARFITHLDRRARSKILDYIRNEDWISRHSRLRYHQLEQVKSKLESELGYKPAREQLIKELSKDIYSANPSSPNDPETKIKGKEKAKLIIKDVESIKNRVYSPNLNSYEEDTEDKEQTDLLKDKKATTPFYEAQKKDSKSFLYRGLTRQEKLILDLYYFTFYTQDKRGRLGMPQQEIAKLLEFSASRISQIRSELLSKLKDKLTARGLNLETCLNNL